MRKVPFELDGHKEVIAPLTFNQMEEFSKRTVAIGEIEDPQEKAKQSKALDSELVCMSVNRANPERKLTPEEIADEWDAVLLSEIIVRVLEITIPGYQRNAEVKVPGEAVAA